MSKASDFTVGHLVTLRVEKHRDYARTWVGSYVNQETGATIMVWENGSRDLVLIYRPETPVVVSKYDAARKKHPVTGAEADEGYHWVQSFMNRDAIVLEADGTPHNCSVGSESYWSS